MNFVFVKFTNDEICGQCFQALQTVNELLSGIWFHLCIAFFVIIVNDFVQALRWDFQAEVHHGRLQIIEISGNVQFWEKIYQELSVSNQTFKSVLFRIWIFKLAWIKTIFEVEAEFDEKFNNTYSMPCLKFKDYILFFAQLSQIVVLTHNSKNSYFLISPAILLKIVTRNFTTSP